MVRTTACAVALLAALLSSCGSRPPAVALDTEVVSASMLLQLVEERTGRIQSLAGTGTVTFDSPEMGGTAGFVLSLRKPDSLLVKFEGPFGIDVGTLFLSREKYMIYNSMENRLVTGVPGTSTMRSVIPFDLTYEQILGAFAGMFPVPEATSQPLEYRIDDDSFYLSFACADDRCRYWVDPVSLLVTRFERLGPGARLLMTAVASGLTEERGVTMPRRIIVRFPEERRQLAIHYSSFTPNLPNPSFAFTIPPNARVTYR